jgi:hypothetical protein
MGIDLRKSLNVAMIPIAILVGIGIVTEVIRLVPFLNLLLCLVGIPLAIVGWVVTAWSGYKAVKEAQMDLVGGAVTGALTGAIAGFVNALISFVLSLAGIGMDVASNGADLGTAVGVGFGIVAIIIAPIVGAIFGAILGAIGAFIAGNMGKK